MLHPFRIFDAPASGLNLVESSAGTGKTYSITSLVVRFLAESRVAGPGSLLVVTFTKAATQELRDRISGRIREAADALREPGGDTGDAFLEELKQQFGGQPEALRNLERALTDFDQAAIYTIHGFCQQALQEYVFESGTRFDIDYSGNIEELMQEAADDIWRGELNRLAEAGEREQMLLQFLLSDLQTPDAMLKLFSPLAGKPYLKLYEAGEAEAGELLDSYHRCCAELAETWDSEAITKLLTDAITSKALNNNKYRLATIQSALPELNRLISAQDWSGIGAFRHLDKFGAAKLSGGTSSSGRTPEHPFFDAVDAFLSCSPAPLQEGYYVRLYRQFLDRLELLKEQRRQRSFDDILIMARDAVRDNQQMRMRLRAQYPVALVDEFQDTDPVQLDIFLTLYGTNSPDHALYMIGDPKQSIYKFRGADIHSYIAVRSRPGVQCFTLDKNYRSVKTMVDAVTELFLAADGGRAGQWPGGISFAASQAHRTGPELRIHSGDAEDETEQAALHFLLPDGTVKDKEKKEEALSRIAHQAACEMVRLLNLAGEGRAEVLEKEQWRPLRPGDIAVLVRDRYEAATFKKALMQHGIKSVHRSSESVFKTEEAGFLLELLHLVRENTRPAQLRAFLFRDEIGQRMSDLQQMEASPELLSEVIEGFAELRQVYARSGFTAMLRRFLNQEIGRLGERAVQVRTRILSLREGERIFTNLMHLNELIDAFEREHRSGADALIKWLSGKITEADGRSEEGEIRLDTDDDLVQIVTMHSSKGLEYPIVFCPSLWFAKSKKQSGAILWHEDGKTHADLSGLRREDAVVQQRIRLEELAESLRLMYVALTRARLRCYVSVAAYKESQASALAYALRGEDYALGRSGGAQAFDLAHAAEKLAQLHPALMHSLRETPYALFEPAEQQQPDMQALVPERPLPQRPDWYVTSYSAIKKQGEKDSGAGYSSFETAAEGGKPDQQPAGESELGAAGTEAAGGAGTHPSIKKQNPKAAQTGKREPGIFDFPKGARPGTLIHRLFEELDFTRLEADGPALVRRCLADEGYEAHWEPVLTEMLRQVLGAGLPESGARLAEKGPAQTVDELEFYFHLERARAAEISGILSGGPSAAAELKEEGFMTGFIDLVFEHEGRYYIADYKSDWLGGAPEDYGAEALQQAMQERGYALQYPIYLVALSRWLRSRLGEAFDYDTHIGGAYYLFVRGMTAAVPGSGIYFDRPDAALIETLDHYFKGEAHAAGAV